MSDNLPTLVREFKTLVPFVGDLFTQYYGDDEAAAKAFASPQGQAAADVANFAMERFDNEAARVQVLDTTLMLMSELDTDPNIVLELLQVGFNIREIEAAINAAHHLSFEKKTDMLTLLINLRRRFTDLQEADDYGDRLAEIIEELQEIHFSPTVIVNDDEEDEDEIEELEELDAVHTDESDIFTMLRNLQVTGKALHMRDSTMVITIMKQRS